MKILYSIGDSFVYRGPEYTTWSSMLSDKLNYIDANNGMSGSSNDRTCRSIIRDISRVEIEGKLWTETTGEIDCKLEDLFIVVGWTSPFRFEWFKDGEYFSSRMWENSKFKNKNNSEIDFIFDNKISEPLSDVKMVSPNNNSIPLEKLLKTIVFEATNSNALLANID